MGTVLGKRKIGIKPSQTEKSELNPVNLKNWTGFAFSPCGGVGWIDILLEFEVLLWTPTYGRSKAGRQAQTYIQQLCEDTGWSPEYLPEATNNREKWRERVRDIRAGGRTWWWWWWWWEFNRNSTDFRRVDRSLPEDHVRKTSGRKWS